MFGEQISRSPRIASPWSNRLSSSVSTSASTTAPPTPPSSHPLGVSSHNIPSVSGKHQDVGEEQLPALHLLNMSNDDALSDISDEADGFFSLDMDVSIDQQLSGHETPFASHQSTSNGYQAFSIPSLSERFDPSPQRASRDSSNSPLLNPAVRRASETVAYSSSPLQGVGLDPVMASRSRNSPTLNNASVNASSNHSNHDTQSAPLSSSFGPIAPEVDQKGNLEYKLKILPPSRERFNRLVTQLKWRLLEGGGLAVYEIGVLDDGTLIGLDPDSMKDSLKLLSLMAAEVGAGCQVQRVLALEKVSAYDNHQGETIALAEAGSSTKPMSSRLVTAESERSLRALAPDEALDTLQPYICTAGMDEEARTHLLQTGSAGLYRFDIAEQQANIPAPLARVDADAASVTVVDPLDAVVLATNTEGDAELAMSAQTKRRVLKANNALPSAVNSIGTSRTKRDILDGRDQSEIVYLPSKEEKRILRAAAEADSNAAEAAERALSHTEAKERRMMAKMTRVADSIQPKTARARARARKVATADSSANVTPESEESSTPSPTPSPAMKPTNAASMLHSSAGAYSGYENVMSAFGVLSERAARTLYGRADGEEPAAALVRGRLIVEAVVRRDADSEDNYVDFQGAKNKLRLDAL